MTRSRLVFGLLFIGVGVLLFADRAGAVEVWSVVATWWPTVVILSGVAQMVARPRNVFGGAVLAAVGVVLLLWRLDVIDGVALVWPVLLVGLGLWLLLSRSPRPVAGVGELVDVTAILSDRSGAGPVGSFAGGSVTTVLGDVRLDLTRSTLDASGATLHVTTILGDLKLDVPAGWDISVTGPELLGDVTLRRAVEPPDGAPVLRLRVLTLFGDVTVRSDHLASS